MGGRGSWGVPDVEKLTGIAALEHRGRVVKNVRGVNTESIAGVFYKISDGAKCRVSILGEVVPGRFHLSLGSCV